MRKYKLQYFCRYYLYNPRYLNNHPHQYYARVVYYRFGQKLLTSACNHLAVSEDDQMVDGQFAKRLAQVRARFAAALPAKILETFTALPNLAGDNPDVALAVGETYRRLHGICGVGPTVGLAATGCAARNAELVLFPAYRDGRGLTLEEVASFRQTLHALCEAARQELTEMTKEAK